MLTMERSEPPSERSRSRKPHDTASDVVSPARNEAANEPTYHPLPHSTYTRLVVLHPGRQHENIECSLQVVDLGSSPCYIAISYTWGSAIDEKVIQVDGHLRAITHNLHDCLRAMRDPFSTVILWVDALSISQNDLDEKGHQVAMIGKIFSQAVEVRAWLGIHRDESEVLFRDPEIINRARRSSEVKVKLWAIRLYPLLINLIMFSSLMTMSGLVWSDVASSLYLILLVPVWIFIMLGSAASLLVTVRALRLKGLKPATYEYSRHVQPLRHLLKRDYWHRTWTVQEITLAKRLKIFCGCDSMEWHAFLKLFFGFEVDVCLPSDNAITKSLVTSIYLNRPQLEIAGMRAIKVAEENKYASNVASLAFIHYHKRTILDLMIVFNLKACAQPHDRVYALLSLETNDEGLPEILPDYRMSMQDLAVSLLRRRLKERDNSSLKKTLHVLTSLRLRPGEIDYVLGHLRFSGLQIGYSILWLHFTGLMRTMNDMKPFRDTPQKRQARESEFPMQSLHSR